MRSDGFYVNEKPTDTTWDIYIKSMRDFMTLCHIDINEELRPEVPRGFQEVKVTRFNDSDTGWYRPPLPPGNASGTHFC